MDILYAADIDCQRDPLKNESKSSKIAIFVVISFLCRRTYLQLHDLQTDNLRVIYQKFIWLHLGLVLNFWQMGFVLLFKRTSIFPER